MYEGCEPVDHNERANAIRKRMDEASAAIHEEYAEKERRAVRRRRIIRLVWTAVLGYTLLVICRKVLGY